MSTDNYPAPPTLSQTSQIPTPATQLGIFPNDVEKARLDDYEHYKRLFMGRHFEAFKIKIDSDQFNRAYSRLRYVAVNFAGLLSKIMADMLFSEPPTIKLEGGDQAWVDAFWRENEMDIQCYESALSCSYLGDAVFKLRAGQRDAGDDESTVICEDITPRIFFPRVDNGNVRAEPKAIDLKWTFTYGDNTYLQIETHEPNKITNKLYLMKNDKIEKEVQFSEVGMTLEPEVETKIDDLLVTHVANFKTGDRYFGISDYNDLESLFYALNNRLSKIDNILDKHGDPILSVPPGILDEKGNVKKKALGVIEFGEGENSKPEYIVWDASLQSAFTEIEKLVDFLYLTAEISPDILGLGQGKSDSGKALKMKLLRTIAKVQRKRLYYDQALKEIVYNAQVFAQKNSLTIDGVALKGTPVKPEIIWQDGLPIDVAEMQADIIARIDAGLESKVDAIMELDNIDEKAAKKKLDAIEAEQPKITLPKMNLGVPNSPPNTPSNAQSPGQPKQKDTNQKMM